MYEITTEDPPVKGLGPAAHDRDIEVAVLGSCMYSPTDYALVASILDTDDFYLPAHQVVWDVMGQQVAKGAPIDPLAMRIAIDESGRMPAWPWPTYLFELSQSYTPGIEFHAEHLRAVRDRRDAEALAVRIRQAAADPTADPQIITTLLVDHQKQQETRALKQGSHPYDRNIANGWDFYMKGQVTKEPVWGTPERAAWAHGESTMIVAGPGLGKTTISQQILMGRLGILSAPLGMPIQEGERVLYLAMDRPFQISRSLGRLITPHDEKTLRDRLVVWEGPLPGSLMKNPEMLAELADRHRCDTVIVDSLKNCVMKPSDEESALTYDAARQIALRAGQQLWEVHHQRKGGDDNTPKTMRPVLDKVYGSTWFAAGAGSVLFLTGQQGDPDIRLWHLKQPTGEVGPLDVRHDYARGMSTVMNSTVTDTDIAGENQHKVLRELKEAFRDVGATAKQLMDATGIPKSTFHRVLQRLKDDGQVYSTGPQNAPKYKLTPQGLSLVSTGELPYTE